MFNLATDRAEQNDLSAADPARFAQMLSLWDRYDEENGVIY
jgi:hypothetical protein